MYIHVQYIDFTIAEHLCRSQATNIRLFQLKEFADDNFKFDENGGKFYITSNFSFSHSVFKRLLQQTHENKGLFEKGLISTFEHVE